MSTAFISAQGLTKVFPGASRRIECKIPSSVATMNVCLSDFSAYFFSAVVEPMKSHNIV